MAQELVVKIIGDATSLERAMRKSTKTTKTFQSSISKTARISTISFGSIGRSVAGVTTALVGGAGLAYALHQVFEETQNAQQASAQTQAVLKSTGRVAGITAQGVEELSLELMKLSGVSSTVIRGGENLLLTFRNVRNVAGENNDIFDQATLAALDMSVALDRNLAGAAKVVGRALENPIKGISSLRRVNVTFTKAQEKTIKTLVESGHVLEAQKIILGELEQAYGGSAEAAGNTFAGRLSILRGTVLNLGAALAASLLPAITEIVDRLTAWFSSTENQERVTKTFSDVVETLGNVISKTGAIAKAFSDLVGGWKEALTIVIGAFIGFKAVGIASAQAVLFANRVAAAGTAAAWRAALISTGFGILVVAAGIAAAEIIAHWDKVKLYFREFWLTLKQDALWTFLQIVEPFSHLPFHAGEWARNLKEDVLPQLEGIRGELQAIDDLQANIAEAKGFEKTMREGRQRGTVFSREFEARGRATETARETALGLAKKKKETAEGIAKRLRAARVAARQEAQDRAAFAVEQASATASLADDLAALNKYNALLARRIRGSHGTLELEREQFQVQQEIADVLARQAEAQKAARATRQFRILGFGPGGAELVPSAATLRKQLGKAEQALQGTFLDTKKTRSLVARIRKVLADGVHGISEDVRRTIQGLIDDLREQQQRARVDVTRFQASARGQFVGAAAGGGGRPIQVNVQIDGATVAKATARHNENQLGRRHKQRSHSRRVR